MPDPRYLEPPDLLAEEPECPDCPGVVLDDTLKCSRCGVTWDEDALRDAEEARAESPEWS